MTTYISNQSSSIYVPEVVAVNTANTLNLAQINVGNQTANIEMDATSAQLAGKNYVFINHLCNVAAIATGAGNSYATIDISTKPIGGAYVQRLLADLHLAVTGEGRAKVLRSVDYVYQPVAQEYIDGMTVKITIIVNCDGNGNATTSNSRSYLMTCK